MKEYIEQEEIARWNSYASANDKFPNVRVNELNRQLELVDVQKGEIILEVGTGNGILTRPLAERTGFTGKVYSFDYRKENLISAMQRNTSALPIIFVPQQNNPQAGHYNFPIPDNLVDKVSTIASFHHYDDRDLKSGTSGRANALKEFYRVLKPNGKLIIGDIASGTSTQKYFDGEMNNSQSPAYCQPRGHPHDFMDKELAFTLCNNAGFRNIEFRVEDVPLVFRNEKEAGEFFHMVHNAKGNYNQSLECVKKHLRTWYDRDKFCVEWNLFYLTAEK